MSWTALVPLKPAAMRKSRLADKLSAAERIALSEAMLAHVAAVLAAHDRIGRIVLVSAERPAGWQADWRRDEGRGLNAELEAAAEDCETLVLHADLPLLTGADLDALLDAAARGAALAPDVRDRGTNAVALREERFVARFGEDSFIRFREALPEAAIVRSVGLALDVDMPHDLAHAEASGFRWR